MFRTMLVPLDFSEASLKLLRLARALGTPGTTTIHLFHVAEEESDFAIHSSADLIAFFEEIEVKRDRWLRELAMELEADGSCRSTAVQRARIRSRAKLSFGGVQAFYDALGPEAAAAGASLPEGERWRGWA